MTVEIKANEIKIVATCDEAEYAIRCYDKIKDEYREFYPILLGCGLFK